VDKLCRRINARVGGVKTTLIGEDDEDVHQICDESAQGCRCRRVSRRSQRCHFSLMTGTAPIGSIGNVERAF
jgi:hypothetical protein